MLVRLNNSRAPEDQITIKVCTVDAVTGRVQLGVNADQGHSIFREENAGEDRRLPYSNRYEEVGGSDE
jgi:sRNA-binding carbon storage regulator CsrA